MFGEWEPGQTTRQQLHISACTCVTKLSSQTDKRPNPPPGGGPLTENIAASLAMLRLPAGKSVYNFPDETMTLSGLSGVDARVRQPTL